MVDHGYIEKNTSGLNISTCDVRPKESKLGPERGPRHERGEVSDSEDAKDKADKPAEPDKPDKPAPLQMVAVDHDYIKHSQTGGITMTNKSKDH